MPRQYTGSTTLGAVLFSACAFGCLAIIVFMLGYIALLGWIGFLLYRAYHPAAWPYIGLWEWFGIATVVSIFLPRPAHVTIEK